MEIYCHYNGFTLTPIYNSDYENKKKLKSGNDYKCAITEPRNMGFHKKFFALVNLGHSNTRLQNMTFEAYRAYVTMKAGYYDYFETPFGKMILPKSISFASMDQETFEKLYSSVINVIIIDLDVTKEDILNNLMNFM